MSDAGRKDFSDKIQEGITPDSSKSTQQKLKETVTDTTDKAARYVTYIHRAILWNSIS